MVRILKKQFDFVVSNLAGEDVLPLARFLKNKKNVSEFEIAENIGIELNTARSLLYKLHQINLAYSNRKRDEEKGWYIYYWSLKPEVIPQLSNQIKHSKLKALKNKLHNETNGVKYLCGNRCVVLDFDQASNLNFKCPECGAVMNQKKNSKEYLKTLRCKIRNLESEII